MPSFHADTKNRTPWFDVNEEDEALSRQRVSFEFYLEKLHFFLNLF